MTDIAVNQTVLERVSSLTSLQKRLLHERLRAVAQDAPTGSGRLVAFYQSEAQLDEQALRAHCTQVLPAHMVPQRFIHTSYLALTNTGKLDRRAMRVKAWLSDQHTVQASDDMIAARNDVEAQLCDIWCDVLGVDEISVFDNFFEVGGDSLQIIRILSRAAKIGLSFKPDAIFSHPTIAELARFAGADSGDVSGADAPESVATHGDLPLLPIQRWFFDVVTSQQHHWNQSYLFDVTIPTTPDVMRAAVGQLLSDHAGLRTCFFHEAGEWFAQIVESMDPEVVVVDISQLEGSDKLAAMEQASSACNQSFSLSDGPLFKAVCFVEEGSVRAVNLVAHHLIVDAVSWRQLVTDLQAQVSPTESATATHSNKTPLRQWSEVLDKMTDDEKFGESLSYWERQAGLANVVLPLCYPHSDGSSNTEGECQWIHRRLDRATTEKLRSEAPRELRCSVQELLLSALVAVLGRFTKSSRVTLDLEGHGREVLFESIDVSSTVGWCTSVFPVTFTVNSPKDWASAAGVLRGVKEQLRAVPENGLSHGVFRYADSPSAALNQAPRSRTLFNYLGIESNSEQHPSALTLRDARFGTTRHPSTPRAYQLELNAVIDQHELSIDWAFGPQLHKASTIERLADELIQEITRLVNSDDMSETSFASPTDFPMSGLDQSALDNLSSQLDDLDDD